MFFHLGMLEKAVFFSEYNNINITGETSESIWMQLQNLLSNILVDSLSMVTLQVVWNVWRKQKHGKKSLRFLFVYSKNSQHYNLYQSNNIHKKITRLQLAESSAVQM